MNISDKLMQAVQWETPDPGRYRKMRVQIMYTMSNILHPRVFIFMLSGIVIIFLTFLTTSNAVEIAISGIASVFIGIGVNNYSMIENHRKEDRQVKMKICQSVHILQVVNSMIADLKTEAEPPNAENIQSEMVKIDRFIRLGIQLIEERAS
jgi:hypothetical protein